MTFSSFVALDTQSEKILQVCGFVRCCLPLTSSQKSIEEYASSLESGVTKIVIAHRLSTVKSADMIAYVKDGAVLETGNHEVRRVSACHLLFECVNGIACRSSLHVKVTTTRLLVSFLHIASFS